MVHTINWLLIMIDVKILLVVDDNIRAREIKNSLESIGYEVPYIASSIEDAVDKALELMADLILIDITFKGESDFSNTVPKIPITTPVIYLITNSEESKIQRAQFKEPFNYIMAPYTSNKLKYAIDIVIYKDKIEKMFKTNYKQYNKIIETVNEGTTISAPEGGFVFVNKKFEDMIGFKKEELIGHDILEFMSNDETPLIQNSKKKIRSGEKFEIQCKFRRKDESILWTIAHYSPLFDDYGNHIANLAMHTDITELKKAERKLAEHAIMLTNINDAVIGTDVNYIINYWNKSAEKMYGYSKEEIIGQYSGILKPEFFGLSNEEVLKQLEITGNLNVELVHTTKDGRKIIVDSRNQILYDEIGNRYGLIGINRDITERKKAEKELNLASLYNRSLIEASLDPLVTIGPDGKVTDANKATEKVTGYLKEEIIGSDFSYYFTEPEKANQGYKKVFKEGFVKDYPLEIQHKNGQTTPVLYNASVYKDETGKILGVFAAARDVSQIIQAEKNNQLLANVVESTDDAIIVKSLDGIILNWNIGAERIYGYSAEEAIGKNISILAPKHLEREIFNLIERIKKSEKIHHYETLRLKKDGELINVSITLSPVFDNSGNLIAISTIARDITENKKIEKERKLASLYNRSLIEASLDPLVTIGPDGKVTDANKATEKVTGYLKEEIIGSDFSYYFTEPEKANQGYKKVFKEGFVKDYPLEIQHKNGQTTPVLYNASVYKDETGKILGVFAAARDISKYKKAQNSLLKSEKKYRDIYEESFDGLFITSPEGKILDMNKKGIEMFGYDSKEEVMNLDLAKDVYANPKDRDKILKTVNEQGSSQYEIVVKKKNQEEMITHCSLSAIKKNGVITSYRGIIRDITQSKKAENAIIRAKEEWENTFDAVPDLIVILDTDFKVVRANKAMADKFNTTPEEMVGLTCYEAVHGLSSAPGFCPFIKLLEDGKEHTSEIHEENLKGDFIVSVSPLYDDHGELMGVVHVARDITERIKIENDIKKSLDEKEVLLREIHHRVKNNLQIIASLLNLQECNENQSADIVLKESMGRVKAMATIHEKLYGSPSLSEINFRDFTEKLVYDILYSYGKKMIQTNLLIDDINLNIDTAMPLGLIINELVTNSVKYAFPNSEGIITIKLNSYHDHMELTIADNGVGLPEDFNMEHIDSLGLELVKNLVEQLEGNLKISTACGTEFKITFKEVKYKERV